MITMMSKAMSIVMVAIVMIALIGAGCTSTNSSNSMSNAPSTEYQKAIQGVKEGERTFTATVSGVSFGDYHFGEYGYKVTTDNENEPIVFFAYKIGLVTYGGWGGSILIANSSQGSHLTIGDTYQWVFQKYSKSEYWIFVNVTKVKAVPPNDRTTMSNNFSFPSFFKPITLRQGL